MKVSIGKVVNLVKDSKKESIIIGVVVMFIVIIGCSTLINNNSAYKIKSNELLELSSTSYQNDNLFVKKKTISDMEALIVKTEINLNKELDSLLNECTELEVECVVDEDLILDIKNSKSVLQTKVDEVNKKALDLKLDTSKVLNNQELNYVNKVSEINKMIDTENKRLDEAEKAEEEKKAQELAEQQVQELAVAETQEESTSNSSSNTSSGGGSTSSGSSSSAVSSSSSGSSSTSSGGSYSCAGTMVADQSACEDLINSGGGNTTIISPDLAVCSNPPGGYFCSEEKAYSAGYEDPNDVLVKYPEVDTFGIHPETISGYKAYRVIYSDYDSGHSYDFYGNQVE